MNSFSFNRFGKTLRWVMAVNLRTLLMWTIGSVVAVFVGELMTAEIRNLSAYQMVYLYGTMGSALFILVSLIMASTIVSSVNEKRKRQAFLMMPSTNLEKFLSLLVYSGFCHWRPRRDLSWVVVGTSQADRESDTECFGS